MALRKLLSAAACAALLASAAQAATIVNYDLTGLPGSGTPPVSAAATTVIAGLTSADPVTRGAGTVATVLANGFSSNDWTLVSSEAIALASDDYFQFGFDVDATHSVSISSFDVNLRRSAAASPDRYVLYASLDDFATPPTAGSGIASWQYLSRNSGTAPGTVTPFQWMTTDTPGQANGNPISTQDLSGVAFLQNIAPGTSVTFRVYAYGAISGSAASNTVAFGRVQGPKLSGEIVEVPEPATVMLLGCMAMVGLAVARRRS